MLQDARLALRLFARDPMFAIVSVVTLAFGIGANLAMFSVANAALWQPLAFQNPDRLVEVHETRPQGGTAPYTSLPNYADWRASNRSFSEIGAYTDTTVTLTGSGDAVRLDAIEISASMLPLLGVEPLIGRNFTVEEDRQRGAPAVLLSHRFWEHHFGGDPTIVGRTLTINGEPQTIVGVMPIGFQFPVRTRPIDLWLPIERDSFEQMRLRDGRLIHVVARLQPDTTVAQSNGEMARLAERLGQMYPATNAEWGALVIPLHEDWFGSSRPALLMLMGAVGFVLLIACGNLASLALARSMVRQRDMVVRRALGASRLRLVRQSIVQSVVIALPGGALGLVAGLWIRSAVLTLAPASVPRVADASLDSSTLLVAFVTTVVAALLIGAGPAWFTTRASSLGSERGSAGGARHNRFLRLVLVGEIAGGLVLLVGASLFGQSLLRLMSVDPGFDPSHVLAVPLELSPTEYPDAARRAEFFRATLDRIEAIPGVESAAAAFPLPFEGAVAFPFVIDGAPAAARRTSAYYRSVSPAYFATLRIPLKRGRVFTRDDRASATQVVVINEVMAGQYFRGEDPLGRRLTITDRNAGDRATSREIVGVVGNVRHLGLDRPSGPEMYVPYQQAPSQWMSLAIRTAGPPISIASVADGVHDVDAAIPVQGAQLMNDRVARSADQRRFNAQLVGAFAVSAVLLAMLGILGTTAYIVAQRTPEIAVRIAIGATLADVLGMILGGTLRVAIAGVVLGLGVSAALSRVIQGFLFDISAFDPATLFVVGAGMLILALLAGLGPARRAAKVDPVVALRRD